MYLICYIFILSSFVTSYLIPNQIYVHKPLREISRMSSICTYIKLMVR